MYVSVCDSTFLVEPYCLLLCMYICVAVCLQYGQEACVLVQLSIYRKLFVKYHNDASLSSRKLGDHESIQSETVTLEYTTHTTCESDTVRCGAEAIRYIVDINVCKSLLAEEASVIEMLVSLQPSL